MQIVPDGLLQQLCGVLRDVDGQHGGRVMRNPAPNALGGQWRKLERLRGRREGGVDFRAGRTYEQQQRITGRSLEITVELLSRGFLERGHVA